MAVIFLHVQECTKVFSNVNNEQLAAMFFENDVNNEGIKLEQEAVMNRAFLPLIAH